MRLPIWLRAPLALLLISLNTIIHCLPLFLLAALKFLLPIKPIRHALDRALVWIAESWIGFNSALIDALTGLRLVVEGLEGIDYRGRYLVFANHQSWVDIPILQKALNRRAPFKRFFLKSQLIWVPMLGLAWWALDFPFMKRYSRAQIEARPELAGVDVAATRKACERFANSPVSIMNFVEGTRFTPAKQQAQESPFAHLLRPRAGGIAFVLAALGDSLDGIIDVTVVYPAGRPTMSDLLADRIPEVRVQVQLREIPAQFRAFDYQGDPAAREAFQIWLNQLWSEKDARITALLAQDRVAAS